MKDERRERLRSNKVYQAMEDLTRYMDRYYLDALTLTDEQQHQLATEVEALLH